MLSEGENIGELFELIYGRYCERLLSFALKLSGNRELSEQIVQDLFVSLWERRESLVVHSLENYLFKCVKYQLFRWSRNEQVKSFFLVEQMEVYVDDNLPETDLELLSLLAKAIEQLPEKRRRILMMSKMSEMTPDEIASLLNLSRQTVKNQLSQAMKQLRLALKDYS